MPPQTEIDPNLPVGLLQSSRTPNHRFSCLASNKQSLVTSLTRPVAVIGRKGASDSSLPKAEVQRASIPD
jgi:hypothetical protein